MTVCDNKYIPAQDKDFFVLLRAGLWHRKEGSLSNNPNWEYIYKLALEQAVIGIVSEGISVVGFNKRIPSKWYERFANDSSVIAKRNIKVNELQYRICDLLDNNNIKYVILKGQVVAQYYPNPLLRSCGDIDILLQEDDFEFAISLLKTKASSIMPDNMDIRYGLYFGDIEVELHTKLLLNDDDEFEFHLKQKYVSMFQNDEVENINIQGVKTKSPNILFHLPFMYLHLQRHFYNEGIGLRQFCDIAMVINREYRRVDAKECFDCNKGSFNMELWPAVYVFCIIYLGLENVLPSQAIGVPFRVSKEVWRYCKKSGNFGINQNKVLPSSNISKGVLLLKKSFYFFPIHWTLCGRRALSYLAQDLKTILNATKKTLKNNS